MEILLYSNDRELELLFKEIEGHSVSVVHSFDEINIMLSDFVGVLVLDYDDHSLRSSEVNEQWYQEDSIIRIIISKDWEQKDFIKHQKRPDRAFGYLKRPFTSDFAKEILEDFSYSLFDEVEEEEVDFNQLQDLNQLRPKEEKVIPNHPLSSEKDIPKQNPYYIKIESHINIQKKFDAVFDENAQIVSSSTGDLDLVLDESNELPDVIKNENEGPTLEIKEEVKISESSSNDIHEEIMSDKKDEGMELEFNVSEEETAKPVEATKDSPVVDEGFSLEFNIEENSEDEGKLSFNMANDNEPGPAVESSANDLDLGSDDGIGLSLGDDDSASVDTGVGELEFGNDDSASVDTGVGELELGSDNSAPVETGVGELEFGNDDSAGVGGLELGAEIENKTEGREIQEEIKAEENVDLINDDDLLNIPGAPTDEDMEISGNENEVSIEIPVQKNIEVTVSKNIEIPREAPQTFEPPIPKKKSEPLPSFTSAKIPEDELLRLQATIRQLREERELLLRESAESKISLKLLEQENLSLRAELDETKIELDIIKKRRHEEVEEFKYQLRKSEDKGVVFEEKNRRLEKELEKFQIKYREEVNQIRTKERELENQLELVSVDSENQVATRDHVILTLKRKIDSLEFNMENAAIKEQKSKEDKIKLEDRLDKIMKTLRGSIKILENDLDIDEELLKDLKKTE